MPQYPHRPIVQAVDRLTAQMKRIADLLDTPTEEVPAPLPPDNGARIIPRVMLPGTEEHAQVFQDWLHDRAAEWTTTVAPRFRFESAVNGWMWTCRCGEADGLFADQPTAASSAQLDHPDCSAPSPAEVRAQRSKRTP